MEAQSIKEYEKLEKYYWWFVGRRKIIDSVLNKYFSGSNLKILDWGCGPGGNFQFLEKYGKVLGVDSSDEAIRFSNDKGITNIVKAGDLSDFKSDEKFDLVVGFDVLEHIQEDEKFLSDLYNHLASKGHVLVTVPAYKILWSGLDDLLGHKRRYIRSEVVQIFRKCGYEVLVASYFICFLSPAFVAYRMLQKIAKPITHSLGQSVVDFPGFVNLLFVGILRLEALAIPHFSLPFGTSIIVLARKKA